MFDVGLGEMSVIAGVRRIRFYSAYEISNLSRGNHVLFAPLFFPSFVNLNRIVRAVEYKAFQCLLKL